MNQFKVEKILIAKANTDLATLSYNTILYKKRAVILKSVIKVEDVL